MHHVVTHENDAGMREVGHRRCALYVSNLKRIEGVGKSFVCASRFLPVSHRIDRFILTSSASRMRPYFLSDIGRLACIINEFSVYLEKNESPIHTHYIGGALLNPICKL